MSKRKTSNRLTLCRSCGTCEKTFTTTADTPFMRTIKKDGHYKNTYYCSESCKRKSYTYTGWWDGKTEERKKERDAKRDRTASNKAYYAKNQERMRARRKAAYWANPEAERAANAYYKQKRKLIEKSAEL